MTREESLKEIVIPRLKEALARYEAKQGDFLVDSAIEIINGMLMNYEKHGALRPAQRAFALDLIKNSFRLKGGIQ